MPALYSLGEETILPGADRINMEKEAKLITFFSSVVLLWPKCYEYLIYGRSQLKMRSTVDQKKNKKTLKLYILILAQLSR